MSRHSAFPAILSLVLFSTTASAGTKPLVEMTDNSGRAHCGRVEVYTKSTITLMQTDGRLRELKRRDIKSFKKIAARFEPKTASEVATDLGSEIGKGYVVKTTQHYVVARPSKSKTSYGSVFENVFNAFHYQFRRRNIPLQKPEFPLVAIVFRDQRSFAEYAAKDGVRVVPGVLGYYHRHTNRVAVFESTRTAALDDAAPSSTVVAGNIAGRSGMNSNLADTITHETMHQVGFNTGVHPRRGNMPKWIIEGLAMTFEAPGFLTTSGPGKAGTRLNRERFVWFRNYQQTRRPKKSLRTFIEADGLFRSKALDAYSQAWAMSFFFLDQPARSYKFRKYLNAVTTRDTTKGYSKADRVRDFEAAFGEIERVEVDFLRAMKKLNVGSVASR